MSLCITQHSCFLLFSYLLTSGFILNWSSAIKASLQSSNEVIAFPPWESHCFYCWHRLWKGKTLSSQCNKVSVLNHHKHSSASSFIQATPPCTAQPMGTGCCQSSHPTKLNHRWIHTFWLKELFNNWSLPEAIYIVIIMIIPIKRKKKGEKDIIFRKIFWNSSWRFLKKRNHWRKYYMISNIPAK